MKPVFYETHVVTLLPLDDGRIVDAELQDPEPAYNTSVIDLLEFMAGMPLKDQVYMLANTLTVSGYTQKEIADQLGIAHQTYRNHLLAVRQKMKDRGLREL